MKNILIITGVAVLLLVGGVWWSNSLKSQQTSENLPILIQIAPDDYTVGPENAPVTLIEYLDFECEACGAYFPLIKQLEQDFPDDLKVILRYFPLPGHRNGMTAALAAEAAARQGKYSEMHDVLFQEQVNWGEKSAPTPEVFEGYAEQLGLDMEQFKRDVASQSVTDRVQRDIDSGRKLGNTGTPTFFLNGRKIDNPRSYAVFRQLVADEIKRVTTQN
jgi:protein-disulfide isomerase